MNIKDILEVFFDESIRPEVIIHIGTQITDDSTASYVKEELELDYEGVFNALAIPSPTLDDVRNSNDIEGLSCYFRQARRLGFLVKFATPVPSNLSEYSYSFSWGHYATKWLYAETYEGVCAKAIEWQREYIESLRSANKEGDK